MPVPEIAELLGVVTVSGHAYAPDCEFVVLSSSAVINEEGYAM